MTYACPAWEFAADTHLLKLQRLQNKVLRSTGNFPVRDLHVTLKTPCFYDFITKLCWQQAEVIQNHHNPNVRSIGQGEAPHRKYKILKLGSGQTYERTRVQVTKLPLQHSISEIRHNLLHTAWTDKGFV
jgi:hypothetical protein